MKIDHIAMYVNDLDAAKGFFTTYFGAQPGELYHNRKTGFLSYFLRFSDGARLELMQKPGTATRESRLRAPAISILRSAWAAPRPWTR